MSRQLRSIPPWWANPIVFVPALGGVFGIAALAFTIGLIRAWTNHG